MNGGHRLAMYLIGKTYRIILFVLAMSILLAGCIGRGDWDYDLVNGYKLIRSSAHTLRLCCDENLRDQWDNNTIVLKQYYVTMVTISDPFVGLQGIPTQDRSASDEELNTPAENYQYYLLDSVNHLLYGPCSKEAFYDKCEQEDATGLDNWVSTKNLK